MLCSAASRLSPNRRRQSVAGSIKDTRAPRQREVVMLRMEQHSGAFSRPQSFAGRDIEPDRRGLAPVIAETGRGRSPLSRQTQPDLFSGALPKTPGRQDIETRTIIFLRPSPTMAIAAQSAHMCKRKTRKSRPTRFSRRPSRRFRRAPSIECSASGPTFAFRRVPARDLRCGRIEAAASSQAKPRLAEVGFPVTRSDEIVLIREAPPNSAVIATLCLRPF